jgi:dolichyl-phosphate beta-glucosyltransferase
MSDNIEVSIVIPAYNEEKRIGHSLEKILNYIRVKTFSREIIVVNDGSRDNTSSVLAGYKDKIPELLIIENEVNRGKGYSVKKGILQSRGKYIIFSDADLSTPIEEADKILSALKDNLDLALGSRHVPGAEIRIRQPLHRHLMGRFFNFFVRLVAIPNIKDTQCGFKGFRRDCAFWVFQKIDNSGWSFDVEAIYLAYKAGFTIKEVPVVWLDSPNSRISLFTDPLKMFIDVLKIPWKHRNTDFSGDIPNKK